jgi:hypothetical protein
VPPTKLERPEEVGGLATDSYTTEEIGVAIASFTSAQLAKIKILACRYAKKSGIEEDEIQSAATFRLMEHSCRRHFTVFHAYLGAMKSIASKKNNAKASKLVYVDFTEFRDIVRSQWDSEQPTPEGIVISRDNLKKVRELGHIIFSKNRLLCILFDGLLMGLKGEELRIYAGLSRESMETLRKTLKAGLAKLKEQVQ